MQYRKGLLSVIIGCCCISNSLAIADNEIIDDTIQADSCSISKWKLFKEKYGKSNKYDASQDKLRMSIFCNNLRDIIEHNTKPDVTFKRGLNHLSDLTAEERARMISGFKFRPMIEDKMVDIKDYLNMDVDVPEELDWSHDAKRVSPARDQGDCGSCWAFAIVGMLEGQELPLGANLTSGLVPLSEQQLVDCDKKNLGCEGGDFIQALSEIKRMGGIMKRSDYDYKSGETGFKTKCQLNKDLVYPTTKNLTSYKKLKHGDEEMLRQIVASYGPVSVAIEANDNLVDYKDGIYHNKNCREKLNHAVLLVGYGKDNVTGLEYWKIKNSWTEDWGQNGFGYMSRNRKNNCGIASYAVISLTKAK